MMKLWTFGDSFTAGNGCLSGEKFTLSYKKSENDLVWTKIVSKRMGLELLNFGLGLYSNDKIFDSVIKNFHSIKQDDIVIIGSTFYSRFDVPYGNKLITLSPTNLPENNDRLLNEIIVIMDDPLLKERYVNRITFLMELFKEKQIKCLEWSVESEWMNYEKIKEASGNTIDDLHWSFKGHSDFANEILKRLNYE